MKCFPIPMSKINTEELQFIPKIWIIIETSINMDHIRDYIFLNYLPLWKSLLLHDCDDAMLFRESYNQAPTWFNHRWKFKTIWSESRFIPATPSAKLNVRLIWNSCWIAPRPWQRSVAILLSSFQAYLSKVWLEPWNIYF